MTAATTIEATLIDEVMPEFDFASRHGRNVDAPAEWVAQAVELSRLGGPASLLFKLRGVRVPSGTLREALTASGFTVLVERPGAEVVAGVNGKFWAMREQDYVEAPRDLEAFRAFDRPGWAQGAISLRIEPLPDGSTHLSTETRVRCVDGEARCRFAAYWAVIRVFSAWLRRDLLSRIALIAEGDE